MFVNIFIAALLTGGRDLHEFSRRDWILFSAMGVIELLTVSSTFYLARRCGSYLLTIEQLKHRLQMAIIAANPLPSENIQAVYTDVNHDGRIIVCGFPNDDGVFYCVEEFSRNFELVTVYTSKIYKNIEELDDAFSEFIDISNHF